MSEPLEISAHDRTYLIHDPGGNIGKALRAGLPYEAKVLEHIYRRGFEGLAVDAGANVGNHTLWLAAVCGLDVIAVEPIDFERLEANVELNGLEQHVDVWRCALGDRVCTAGDAGKGRVRGDGEIPVRRLDDKIPFDRHVALLKVDVEGMEAEVLRGGLETIKRCRPVIYAEAWDAAAHARVAEILEPLEYEHVNTFGATPLEEWEPRPC